MRTSIASEVDEQLRSAAFFNDPYPFYARLRHESPVAWSETEQAWLVTRHADVLTTAQDPLHLSNRGKMLAALDPCRPPNGTASSRSKTTFRSACSTAIHLTTRACEPW